MSIYFSQSKIYINIKKEKERKGKERKERKGRRRRKEKTHKV